MIRSFPIGTNPDTPKWVWEKSGMFSVKSLYEHMFHTEIYKPNKRLWKAKIPLKIKLFMWLVSENAILTKNNLVKIKWKGDVKCRFCAENESIIHLFFECSMVKYIWSLIALVVGANCRPTSFGSFWVWLKRFLPHAKKYHMVGLAGVCWAIWKSRNNSCLK